MSRAEDQVSVAGTLLTATRCQKSIVCGLPQGHMPPQPDLFFFTFASLVSKLRHLIFPN